MSSPFFGSVSAAHQHGQLAAAALARADGDWLERLITRRVAPAGAPEVIEDGGADLRVVIGFGA